MAQHDYIIANGTGSAVRSDINGALGAISTNNSGATEPATTYAYQWWADETTGFLKIRNAANNAWIELFELDGEFGSKTFNGNITLNAQGDLRFGDSDSSNWVAFQAPGTVASNVTWTLPSADGTANQTLVTNGSGTLSWATPTSTSDIITEGNTSAEVVDTGSDGHFKVTTEGTERLRINASGNIGIGTTSPVNVGAGYTGLTINGSSAGTLYMQGGGTSGGRLLATNTDFYIGTVQASGSVIFQRQDGSYESARIDSSGRLLVGTSSAFNTGDVSGGYGSQNPAQIAGTNGSTLSIATSSTAVGTSHTIGALQFFSNAGSSYKECARIHCLADTSQTSTDKGSRLQFSTTANGASSPTEKMRISANGQLYTGLSASSPYNNTVVNAANAHIGADGVLYRSTSSARFKTDVETLENQYADALLSCRPVWYRSIAPGDSQHPDWGYWGFIAEEVGEIDPRLVFWKTHETEKDEDDNTVQVELEEPIAEGVQYDRFVPHLLNLIKRQKEQIEAMEARLSALEAQ